MSDIRELSGVGDALGQKLAKLKIYTVEDLINYVPFRFDDYSDVTPIGQLRPGNVSIKASLSNIVSRYSKRGLHITEALASDNSGSVKVTWFNQPYRAKAIKSDAEYYLSGAFASDFRYHTLNNPAAELVSDFPVNTARLVPVYRLTKGLKAGQMRKLAKQALEIADSTETLPSWLIDEKKLINRKDALSHMHFPSDSKSLNDAKRRLAFEEIFELSLASELNKRALTNEHSFEITFREPDVVRFVKDLPFKLTNDQRKVAWSIIQDLQSGQPMNRLVEGDVGSGKTVIAALAAYNAMLNGYQVALMAPTELLARQHAETLHKLFGGTEFDANIVLLSGSMTTKQKKTAYETIANTSPLLVIGTHALIQEAVMYQKLGLLIIDEQHRFGVEQRKKLQAKADKMPHVLNLTATPIPRTLALTLYGEMDVSVIAEKPPGRIEIKTKVEIQENRRKVYKAVSAALDEGRQANVVCPLIEGEDNDKSVDKIYKDLCTKQLKTYKITKLHGKMSSEEKNAVMADFAAGKTQVLVSTTVIEVGVDVPNATVMVIEGVEQFGLAQLHQLRGRIGRGQHASQCYLVMSTNDAPTRRLRYIEKSTDGFQLAEYDLELRGPGAIYGTMQHGALDLRVAKLTDTELIESARNSAKQFIQKGEKLVQYPQLKTRVDSLRTIQNLN